VCADYPEEVPKKNTSVRPGTEIVLAMSLNPIGRPSRMSYDLVRAKLVAGQADEPGGQLLDLIEMVFHHIQFFSHSEKNRVFVNYLHEMASLFGRGLPIG
jgi:hypothetical protein